MGLVLQVPNIIWSSLVALARFAMNVKKLGVPVRGYVAASRRVNRKE
jgi:hypothetical protein